MERRVAVIGIVVSDRAFVPQVNAILSEHADMILGRMGLPYRERALSIIALIVDGTTDEIGSLTGRLGRITGVRVRSAVTV
jgi:putative iron-only hydrogenase system regulator